VLQGDSVTGSGAGTIGTYILGIGTTTVTLTAWPASSAIRPY